MKLQLIRNAIEPEWHLLLNEPSRVYGWYITWGRLVYLVHDSLL